MAKGNGQQRERRAFTAEFKLEAVRRAEERRAAGVPLTQVARELGVTDDLLRKWRHQAAERGAAPPADVVPGHGRLPSEAEEVRRLEREVARLKQELAFVKSAAVYFAWESRCATGTPRSMLTTGSSRCASCATRWA